MMTKLSRRNSAVGLLLAVAAFNPHQIEVLHSDGRAVFFVTAA